MLELARTSYQLRDDDNIYLGKIEAQLLAAVQEARDDDLKSGTRSECPETLQQVLGRSILKPNPGTPLLPQRRSF